MSETRGSAPTVFVLYGATGDLAKRLVMPGVAALARAGLLPERWALVGSGRRSMGDEDYRRHVVEGLREFGGDLDGRVLDEVAAGLRFAGGGFSADDPGELLDVLERVRGELGEDAQVVHYLALPPSTFEDYTRAIAAHGLAAGSRVVYEKPFGTCPESVEHLGELVLSVF